MTRIELKTPITTPNGEVRCITLSRQPTRRDLKLAQRLAQDEEEQVWHMVCALSEEKLTIEDTDALTLADVRQVMEAFRSVAGLGE
ncbi:phage tail assembly protein [Herbaspirillum seropedicae]|uniref:phage tail assembly protein n=1 Tax=Herbaspirillum seropedicae TaxID=964 RepID=UPI0003027155|nr:phage tail assembly protein [Herbaspirillum seropedicae]AKN63944.1 hypothetical protein ACP92_01075 [Herbaspirillum seropedicae]NQE29316.1 hypothetical protein [Herbaspirillum seropedicae]UMU19856.1 phage tail assembly protein [Herbaspirillum seropedicae]